MNKEIATGVMLTFSCALLFYLTVVLSVGIINYLKESKERGIQGGLSE